MTTTADGRRVQVVYDGNVYVYFVDESKGSRYAKRVWVDGVGHTSEYYEKRVNELAANDGNVPTSWGV